MSHYVRPDVWEEATARMNEVLRGFPLPRPDREHVLHVDHDTFSVLVQSSSARLHFLDQYEKLISTLTFQTSTVPADLSWLSDLRRLSQVEQKLDALTNSSASFRVRKQQPSVFLHAILPFL